MQQVTQCPVCKGAFGQCRSLSTPRDGYAFDCDGCGRYEISRSALVSYLERGRLTAVQHAALSHALRTASRGGSPLLVTTDWLERFLAGARLPSPAIQLANLIAMIGDLQAERGEGYFIDDVVDTPLVGALNRKMFDLLLDQARERKLIVSLGTETRPNMRDIGVLQGVVFGLTLEGWEQYEANKRGKMAGRYGFIAMKFGDPVLDPFVEAVVKPAVRDGIGYDLVDLRNVSRAGVIDNILRAQIRDAAFILVDLTHDNAGAYWEAGYAEGLGKPVIYICEQAKFDAARTHFDTNHCTTVMWSVDDPAPFTSALIATIRRSLDLFPGSGTAA